MNPFTFLNSFSRYYFMNPFTFLNSFSHYYFMNLLTFPHSFSGRDYIAIFPVAPYLFCTSQTTGIRWIMASIINTIIIARYHQE